MKRLLPLPDNPLTGNNCTVKSLLPRDVYAFKKIIFRYLTAGMILIAMLFLLSVLWMYQQQNRAHHQDWNESISKVFQHRLKGIARNLETSLYVLSENPVLQQQFLARDRQAVLATTLGIEHHFFEDIQVSHFSFFTADKKAFLQVHPSRSDTWQRSHSQPDTAITDQLVTATIELEHFGNLVLRLVLPWYVNDNLIGYLGADRNMTSILSVFADIGMADGYLLSGKKQLIDREENLAPRPQAADRNALPDRVVLQDTLPPAYAESKRTHSKHLPGRHPRLLPLQIL